MEPQLKIALISAADPKDLRTWSGSTFFMGSALERHVGRVDYIGPISIPGQDFKLKLARLAHRITGKRTYPFRTLSAAGHFAKDKVRVILFGANLDRVPDRQAVIGKKMSDTVILLFLAKEWKRKGGAIALDTLKSLIGMGIDAKLTVCGVTPPSGVTHPAMTVFPYLDKNIARDRNQFEHVCQDPFGP
jgi:glycosyltransferase involved in cell wall biosynthesis